MDNNNAQDIARRYTEETYATKEDVRKGLNTSLIDPFWSAILSYRSHHSNNIRLYSSSSQTYFVCLVPAIKAKIEAITAKLGDCVNTFMGLEDNARENARFAVMKCALRNIGQKTGETFTDDFIATVINGGATYLQGISKSKKEAVDYFDAYKLVENRKIDINSDYLVKLYVTISKNNNLTSLYRNFDFPSNNLSSFNRVPNGITFTRLEKHMSHLFSFIENEKLPTFVKAAAAYYYINYVKPFPNFNNEIAVLLFKTVINNEAKEHIGGLIPFEEMFKHQVDLDNSFKQTSRGNDLTYVLINVLSCADTAMENFLDICVRAKTNHLKAEHAPRLENDATNVVTPSKSPVSEQNYVVTPKRGTHQVAIPNIEAGLEEKDAHKYEKYLLERNPMLKSSQAHFYARHCTIGSYYTIQMYKKAERVVYETARTSMDTLTNLGFYRKEQIKNKFVYTPIKQENK